MLIKIIVVILKKQTKKNVCRLFYSNDLVPAADPGLVNSHLDFPGIPDKARGKFPVIFHGVVGKDQREEKSPSFFNPEEVVRWVRVGFNRGERKVSVGRVQ